MVFLKIAQKYKKKQKKYGKSYVDYILYAYGKGESL